MIYRKQYTESLPQSAEIIQRNGKRIARWRSREGEIRSGEVFEGKNGQLRVRGKSNRYTARYRNAAGRVVEVATGCKQRVAARAVLAQLERQAELVRSGVLTAAEGLTAEHASQPLSTHLNAYERHLRAKDGNPRRIQMLRRRLERVVQDCRFRKLGSLSAGPVEKWLVQQADAGMGAATRNSYREALIGFGNWCLRTNRVTHNPFSELPRADQNADRRHQRRALSTAELNRLLRIAQLRPLAEHGREVISTNRDAARSPRSRATWKRDPINVDNIDAAVARARLARSDNPALIERLERQGRERALVYKTLALTGLRKSELASLTVGQLDFSGQIAFADLHARDAKNRKAASIPLQVDLAADITSWLKGQLDDLQEKARAKGEPIPARLPPSMPLFYVPSGLTRIFDRDLAAAGIAKRDERGRVVDVHALRVTFGTQLCIAGVALRTAQAAMRHSKPELTANVYIDPKLLDVAGAINALPSLGLSKVATSTAAPPA